MPEYPGGKKALRTFINTHLRYPADALAAGIEGVVTVAYEVNDSGVVESAKVIKSLSPSCNEEALRLVYMLKYGSAYNHGVRVKSNHRINIYFRLPKSQSVNLQISYTESESKKEEIQSSETKQEYTYTISVKN
ncbi:MAG: energy transducer TonB [Bacteroidales bacterium]|jgi:protein TonB|nr:energy transducer TonB [Bacteroidales bacterium]